MRTKKDEKFKLESVEELLGVVNEESAMDIEISKIQSFRAHPFMELLNCGKNKAVKTMQELDRETGIGLIEKKRQGLGKANMIYVKNFVLNNKVKSQSDKKFIKQTKGDKDGNMEVYKSNFSRFEKQTSRIPQDKLQEVRISNSNNNKFNDTYRNNIKSVHIPSEEGECQNRVGRYEGIDDYAATKELINGYQYGLFR